MLSFFPRGVLDEILNLIESDSEGFPSYFCTLNIIQFFEILIVLHALHCADGCCFVFYLS